MRCSSYGREKVPLWCSCCFAGVCKDHEHIYCKILIISPKLIFFQKAFWWVGGGGGIIGESFALFDFLIKKCI